MNYPHTLQPTLQEKNLQIIFVVGYDVVLCDFTRR